MASLVQTIDFFFFTKYGSNNIVTSFIDIRLLYLWKELEVPQQLLIQLLFIQNILIYSIKQKTLKLLLCTQEIGQSGNWSVVLTSSDVTNSTAAVGHKKS